ncbi:FBD-associated F-box protein [Frankliniella fusca]|uniref:FBD-associated F-box protein n=1 Tax=Frankliniella fusca TaxID=407009 RepID=A0AAE1HEA4_9NEOP|nr:FBD-associated F-box protein [Frankliniella fusca]
MLPAEATDRLHQSKIVGSTGVINKLEDDMSAVLNAPMSKEEQWRRYAPLLSQWLKFLEQERKPVTIPVVGGKAEIEDDKDTYDTLRTQLQRILPRTFQQAGCTIYDTLNNSRMRQIIDWDAVGGVSIHGVPLAHSNIIDYVSDLCRERKSFNPPGWQTFAKALGELSLPRDLIKNPKYHPFLIQNGSGVLSTPPYTTSVLATPKRLTAKSKVFEVLAPIHADLFAQDRYLIPGVPLHLRFTRNKDSFLLMSTKKEKLTILDARLIMRQAHGVRLKTFLKNYFTDNTFENDLTVAELFKHYTHCTKICEDVAPSVSNQTACTRKH